jgi:hypothetical protein
VGVDEGVFGRVLGVDCDVKTSMGAIVGGRLKSVLTLRAKDQQGLAALQMVVALEDVDAAGGNQAYSVGSSENERYLPVGATPATAASLPLKRNARPTAGSSFQKSDASASLTTIVGGVAVASGPVPDRSSKPSVSKYPSVIAGQPTGHPDGSGASTPGTEARVSSHPDPSG